NECFLRREACQLQTEIHTASLGPCPTGTTSLGSLPLECLTSECDMNLNISCSLTDTGSGSGDGGEGVSLPGLNHCLHIFTHVTTHRLPQTHTHNISVSLC
uniref:Uncharacterized protein n=1 Tax=Hucho hucho TaxID=62062 RepID=A0A4W5LH43_9TELE